jgi:uncharacterized protein YkwD
MRQTPRRLSRLLLSVLAVCALSAVTVSAASACADAGLRPAKLSRAALGHATLCVINRERAGHGLRALRQDRRLGRVAHRHSRDMVAHRYFAHDSRSGARFSARIARVGWMRGRASWAVGENLAWATGTGASARGIVRSWMHSAAHRANILDARYRVVGIGLARGTPTSLRGGATYTTDFGS